ncbi:outer membrane beta-barrel protein [Aureisphaera sp. CAU 1614]|uniref:Outer membrane beta-barrel protein n=1 Tax=Halomarinibacterium sedimenti TaxID=2857106 RepID=A0A9X1FQD3_9FLAO|nr:TonB-dependent receptor [Halomarinibacterium sedimenti]MBW2938557.1 outer membrane beta-barrel protein [Halomarinibacterium sedimenti]
MKKHLSFLLILFFINTSFGQGIISGKILDGEFNDVLAFANIIVKGTTTGTTSDFDGKYSLEVGEGTYTIEYSFVGYQTKEITQVTVKNGEVKIIDITLNPSLASLDEVVISTTVSKNSESAVLSFQKNSVSLMDGLSLESIKKVGASDIASAVKTIPGVSVQGGKFVYVRGLGDRYTKSILNGMDIPGLDPDRNTLQLDIFPSQILENIVVIKSSTADQPADFTGGVVDIVTKDIPNRAEYSVSLGAGYNRDMHFNNNYIADKSSPTDILGFDNGLRSNPIPAAQEIPLPQQNANVNSILTRRFEKTLAPENNQSFMDYNFSVTAGDRFDIGDNKLGYLASISYRNETQYFDEYINGQIFRKDEANPSNYNLLLDRSQNGELGTNSVLISSLAGISLKTEKSKYRITALHIQNGESQASIFRLQNGIISSNQIKKDNLIYTERAISNLLLNGEHSLGAENQWKIDWRLSPSFATIYDKDFRVTPFRVSINSETGEEVYTIEPSESGDASRFYRNLEEINLVGKLAFENKHTLFGNEAKLKFGGGYAYKQRDFEVIRYSFPFINFNSAQFNGDPNQILLDENIYNEQTNSGVYLRKDSSPSDSFDSEITVASGYLSEQIKVLPWFNAILGVRFEKFELNYTGQRQDGSFFDGTTILDKSDFFPSANLIFDLQEDESQKIRASYSKTTARPSFKEASIAEIFDPISSNTFIGNIDLQPTYIDNFDLRFENYGENGDFFALSGFYKSFTDPIELSFIRRAYGQYTPLNLGDAEVFGGELELRKSLGFITGWEEFNFNFNVSIIESKQNYSEDERQGRLDNLREGETLDKTRQLQGQSPYLINFGITYEGKDNGWKSGFYYNTQGKTLQIVGAADIADVYTLPFHNLKFNVSKQFGKSRNSQISLSFENLLDDDIESVYQSFGTEDITYSKWSPGQKISLGYSLKF